MIAFVVGCAARAWEDYKAAYSLAEPDVIIAVNHIGIELPRVDHWASLHGDLFDEWRSMRAAAKRPSAGRYWTSDIYLRNRPEIAAYGVSACPYPWDGSSGALGLFVAQQIGARKIILCGVPIQNGPHFYNGPSFSIAEQAQEVWRAHLDELRAVRSMSGWTERTLGRASVRWLRA